MSKEPGALHSLYFVSERSFYTVANGAKTWTHRINRDAIPETNPARHILAKLHPLSPVAASGRELGAGRVEID